MPAMPPQILACLLLLLLMGADSAQARSPKKEVVRAWVDFRSQEERTHDSLREQLVERWNEVGTTRALERHVYTYLVEARSELQWKAANAAVGRLCRCRGEQVIDSLTLCRIAARAALRHSNAREARDLWHTFWNRCHHREEGVSPTGPESTSLGWRIDRPEGSRKPGSAAASSRSRKSPFLDSFDVERTRFRFDGIERGFTAWRRDTVAARCDTLGHCTLARGASEPGLWRTRLLLESSIQDDRSLLSKLRVSGIFLEDRILIWVREGYQPKIGATGKVEVRWSDGSVSSHPLDSAGVAEILDDSTGKRSPVLFAVVVGTDVQFARYEEFGTRGTSLLAKTVAWPSVVGAGDSMNIEAIVVRDGKPDVPVDCRSAVVELGFDGSSTTRHDTLPCHDGRISGKIHGTWIGTHSISIRTSSILGPGKYGLTHHSVWDRSDESVRIVPWMRPASSVVRIGTPSKNTDGSWSPWQVEVRGRDGRPKSSDSVDLLLADSDWRLHDAVWSQDPTAISRNRWVRRKLDGNGRLSFAGGEPKELDSARRVLWIVTRGDSGFRDTTFASHAPRVLSELNLATNPRTSADPSARISWRLSGGPAPIRCKVRLTIPGGVELDTTIDSRPDGVGQLEFRTSIKGAYRLRFERLDGVGGVDTISYRFGQSGILARWIPEPDTNGQGAATTLRWKASRGAPERILGLSFDGERFRGATLLRGRDSSTRWVEPLDSATRRPRGKLLMGTWEGNGWGEVVSRQFSFGLLDPAPVRITHATLAWRGGEDSLELSVALDIEPDARRDFDRVRVLLEDERQTGPQAPAPIVDRLRSDLLRRVDAGSFRQSEIPESIHVVDTLPWLPETIPARWKRECTRCRIERPRMETPKPRVPEALDSDPSESRFEMGDPENICYLTSGPGEARVPAPTDRERHSPRERGATTSVVSRVGSDGLLRVRFPNAPGVTIWRIRLVAFGDSGRVLDASFRMPSVFDDHK